MRLGQIGCGPWGRHILRDLRNLGAEVHVAVRTAASRARATEGGAASVVDDLAALPPGLDGYVVALQTSRHAEIVLRLLSTGRPIFVEKPLCLEVGDARRIVAEGGDRVFVMDKWRYHPGVEALAAIARSGELGPVERLQCVRHSWGNPHVDVDSVWILAPHDLSIALEILGHVPKADAAAAELHEGELVGLTGIMDGGRFTVDINGRRPWHRRSVQMACRDGVAVLADGWDSFVAISRDGAKEPEQRPVSDEMPLLRELRTFVDHVRGGPPPRSSAAEGLAVVEAISDLRRLAGV